MRKTARNYLRRVLEISIWPMETASIGCCIWMNLGEQGLAPASQSSRVQRDLSSGALPVSPHLPSLAPTPIKRGCEGTAAIRSESGWGQGCSRAQRWKVTVPRAQHCQQALVRLQPSVPWAGRGQIRQNMLAAGSRVLCPSWLWTNAGGISPPFTRGSAGWHWDRDLLKLSQGRVPQEHPIPRAGSAESLHLGSCTFFLFPHAILCWGIAELLLWQSGQISAAFTYAMGAQICCVGRKTWSQVKEDTWLGIDLFAERASDSAGTFQRRRGAQKLFWAACGVLRAAGDSWRSRIGLMQEGEVRRCFCFQPLWALLWSHSQLCCHHWKKFHGGRTTAGGRCTWENSIPCAKAALAEWPPW